MILEKELKLPINRKRVSFSLENMVAWISFGKLQLKKPQDFWSSGFRSEVEMFGQYHI